MTARVLLVDDDPSTRLFAAMALEPLGVDLVECSNPAQVLASCQAAPVDLVICGMWLEPARTLPDLAVALRAAHERRGQPALLIALADPSDEMLGAQLRPHAWRVLPRPCALPEFEQCLQDAVELVISAPAGQMLESQVVAKYFDGDAALYRAFFEASRLQFMSDLIHGDRAIALGDTQALRRLGHSLKGVLQSLGHNSLGRSAALIERHAASGQMHAAAEEWRRLSAGITEVLSQRAGGDAT